MLYESPHRLLATLEAIEAVFGEAEVVLAREVTKRFEEFRRGTAASSGPRSPRGGPRRGHARRQPARAPAAPDAAGRVMFFRKALPPGVAAEDAEEGRMPFLAHLGELRQRIIVAWSRSASASSPAFSLLGADHHVARPAHRADEARFLEPTEPFWVNMKVALITGGFLVLPVILYQVWAFIAPGLLPHERQFALPFVILSTLCFFVGATFALTVIVPFAVKFLVSYKTENLVPTLSVNRYVDFILKFTLAFGLIFELPLAITLGTRLGLVTPEFLAKNRKYAFLLCFVAAAILTPTPDAFNQLLMAGPLCPALRDGHRRRPGCSAAGRRGDRLTPMRFAELDVPPEVHEGIRAAGFTTATPIQEAALPVALRGKDVAGQAQTGTGKTAAFLIATFTRLLRHPPAHARERRAARPHHRARRASWSSRSTRTRGSSGGSPGSGRRSSSAASTTSSSATRSRGPSTS